MSESTQQPPHMLTFDVEEYFHCEAFREVISALRTP